MNMRTLIYIIIILIYYSTSFTLAQDNTFLKTYVSGYPSSVIQDRNGDYLIIGNSTIPATGGPTGVRLIKVDHLGDTLWTKLYGSVDKNTEGTNIIETVDGNYIACGVVFTPEPHSIGPSDIILTKFNINGDTLWWKTYNVNESNIDLSNDLLEHNNSIYVVGRNADKGLMLKTDEYGNIVFNKKFSFGSAYTEFNSLKMIDDNNLFLFGSEGSFVSVDRVFSKYIICKTNLSGDSLSSVFFGDDSCEVFPNNMIKTLDGNFVFSGYTYNVSTQSYGEYLLLSMYNKNEEMIWEKRIESTPGKVAATYDSGIVFYGRNQNGITLTKLNTEGNILWSREIPFPNASEVYGEDIIETSDGGILVTGYVTYPNEQPEVFLLKTNSEGLLTIINIENTFPNSFVLSQNYPNPFNPSTKISYSVPKTSFVAIKVYDVLGKEITTLVNGEKSVGDYEVEFNGRNLSSGVYFYKMQAGDFVETKKLILMK
ncbi:MAG: T9SS type A sorting domain-containing protein [Ignavibacteria bacterium]|nr:T9SS type A sorting domain-containing protein [Ignavibacteria bacterium]